MLFPMETQFPPAPFTQQTLPPRRPAEGLVLSPVTAPVALSLSPALPLERFVGLCTIAAALSACGCIKNLTCDTSSPSMSLLTIVFAPLILCVLYTT